MQYYYVPDYVPIVLMIVGTVPTSIILGLLLRYFGGIFSESSKLVRFCTLVTLAVATGITIFSISVYPMWFPAFIWMGMIALSIGVLTLFCRLKK